MVNNRILIPVLALAALGAAPAIRASVIDDGAQAFTGAGSFTTTLSFLPFNTTLGTLDSVEILPSATGSGTVTVTNDNTSGPAQLFTFSVDTLLTIAGGGTTTSLSPAFSGSTTLAAGATYTSPTITGTPVTTTNTVTTGLSAFESGPISFTITGVGEASTQGGTNLTINATSAANGAVDVVYNYTAAPVTGSPEPDTLMLAGGALLGLGLLGRRGRAAK